MSTEVMAAQSIKNWKETTLGEHLSEIAMGPFGSNLKVEMFTNEGIPVVRGKNLDGNYVAGEFVYVSEKKADSLRRSVAYPGDFIVTHRGTLGQVSLVPYKKFDRYVTSQSQLRFRTKPEEINNNYLLYFLKSRKGQFELLKNTSQVGVPSIARPTVSVKEIELLLPPLPEQKAIAAVLSSFDDKIESLRRQNKTLEKIAQTIFKEWFVNFTVNGKKLKIDNSTGLPKGWRIGKLEDILELAYGKALKEGDRTGKGYPVAGSSGIVGYHGEYLTKGPGIVVGRKGSMGSVIWIEDNFFPIDTTFYVADKLHAGGLFFQLFVLKRFDFQRLGSDSAVPGLNRNLAYSLELSIPKLELIKEYNTTVATMFQKIKHNNSQIQTLSKLRDLLLPKLMKGEIRIKL